MSASVSANFLFKANYVNLSERHLFQEAHFLIWSKFSCTDTWFMRRFRRKHFQWLQACEFNVDQWR